LLASPAELAPILAGDPASPMPVAQHPAVRGALALTPPLACPGLQRIEWLDEAGRPGSLTFAIGLGHPDRQRLLAAFDPAPPSAGQPPGSDAAPVLVIGAGLAGCAMAAALARRGRSVVLVDRRPHPGGVVADVPLLAQHPALSADDNPRTRLSRAALALAWRLRDELGPALHWCGRWQRVEGEAARYLAGWPPVLARAGDAPAPTAPTAPMASPASSGMVRFDRCALAETPRLLADLVNRPGIATRFGQAVQTIERDDRGWWAGLDAAGRIGPFPAVVIACPDHEALSGLTPPWTPRGHHDAGQVAIGEAPPASAYQPARIDGGFRLDGQAFRLQLRRCRVSGVGGEDGVGGEGGGSNSTGSSDSVGSSDSNGVSDRDRDRERDRDSAIRWRLSPAAIRFDPIDHLPLIGAVPDQARIVTDAPAHARNDRLPYPVQPGLWLATGFGGRGLLWSVLAAELIAARLDDEPPLIEASLEAAVDPARFLRRRLRRLASP